MSNVGRAAAGNLSSDLLIFCELCVARLLRAMRRRAMRSEDRGELSPVSDAELAVGRVEVAFDRAYGKNEALGDVGVRQAVARQGRDLLLPSGQRCQAGRFCQRRDESGIGAGLMA